MRLFVVKQQINSDIDFRVTQADLAEGGNQPSGDVQGFYWNNSGYNTWENSSLKNALNATTSGHILYNFGNTWSNRIENVIWKVSGNSHSYISSGTPMFTVYTNEITESGVNVTHAPRDGKNEISSKIGLMYVSDYGYAATNPSWIKSPDSYSISSIISNNWLYKGVREWTITRRADYTTRSYTVNSSGGVSPNVETTSPSALRRVFFLTKNTKIDMINYDGTKGEPYRRS